MRLRRTPLIAIATAVLGVPWNRVGPRWVLAQYTTASAAVPFYSRQNGNL